MQRDVAVGTEEFAGWLGRETGHNIGEKLGQQSRRQRDKSRLLTLAAGDSQLHPLTVDVGDLQTRGFVESQTGGILSQQEDAMLVALHT